MYPPSAFVVVVFWTWIVGFSIRTVAPRTGGSTPSSNRAFAFTSRYARPLTVAPGRETSPVIFQSGRPSPSASTGRRCAASSVTVREIVWRVVAPIWVRGSTAPVEIVTVTAPKGARTEYRPCASVVAS